MNSKHALSAITAAVLGALAAPSLAADWEMNPRIEAGYLYDNNYRLDSEGSEITVTGPLLDAQFEWRALTPTSEFSLIPRVRATYFPDESDLDAIDYFTNLDWQRRGQRVNTRLRGEFSMIDIITSELPDVDSGGGLGEPDFGDSGRVLVDNRRRYMSLRPSMDFDVSQRRNLQFGLGYADVSFDEQLNGAQIDYKVTDASAGLLTRLNPRSNLIVRLRGARYDLESREDVTNGYGAELQWDRTTAAETRSYLRLGAQNVELLDGEKETAWVAGVGVNFLMGRNELFLDLARNVGPSSAGTLVTRDQLRLRWTRAFTPRLNLLAGVRATRDEDVEEAEFTLFEERSYATGDLGLQWRWQEEYSLRVAYEYTWQEYAQSTRHATSSGAMISVTYEPLQRRR
jgi:hypothetical protein